MRLAIGVSFARRGWRDSGESPYTLYRGTRAWDAEGERMGGIAKLPAPIAVTRELCGFSRQSIVSRRRSPRPDAEGTVRGLSVIQLAQFQHRRRAEFLAVAGAGDAVHGFQQRDFLAGGGVTDHVVGHIQIPALQAAV